MSPQQGETNGEHMNTKRAHTMTYLSYRASKLLGQFRAGSARKGTAALRKAGLNEYDNTFLSELVKAGKIKQTARGWYLKV